MPPASWRCSLDFSCASKQSTAYLELATIFFSYSHKDEALRDELEAHLSMLKHDGLISTWHDRRINPGDGVDDSISKNLELADIILLLVSSDFIGSWYCYSNEMKRAMERHAAGDARVIPIILRHCDWHSAPFGKLLAAPRDGKPVVSWPDRDEAMTDVAKQLRRALTGGSPVSAGAALRPPAAPAPALVSLQAATSAQHPAGPRSSNLRLKQEFTQKDRDDFLRSTFDYVCRYFENSIAALCERHPGVTGGLDRIDAHRTISKLYRHGQLIAECSVRLDSLGGSNGIAFSHQASASTGSFNEMLTVKDGDQSMHFKTMMASWGGNRDKQLSEEGVAEYLWSLFIERAQS